MRENNGKIVSIGTGLYRTLISRAFGGYESEFRGTQQIFVEEFFGILRNTLGTPIFVPWLQGEASLMPKFQPKTMFYAVLNWKRVQFSESHQFWWILES
jgi:hypothetical protein